MANAHGNDGTGNRVEKRKGGVGRIAVAIWPAVWNFIVEQWQIFVAIALALVVVGSAHVLLVPMSESSKSPAIAVLNWMQQIPTKLAFYYLLAALTGAYLGWRWWLSANIRKEIETKEEDEDRSSLSPRDWWVIREIRRRAIIFRTWASLLLVGVIALLFGGIYLVLFVLPQIGESDRLLVQQQQQAIFKERFSRRLQLISEGRYWLKVHEIDRHVYMGHLIHSSLPSDDESLSDVRSIPETKDVIFAFNDVEASVSSDRGETWGDPGGLELDGEKISRLEFSEGSWYGMVAGRGGSVFVTSDGGQNWRRAMKLGNEEVVSAEEFSADGQYGVIIGDQGSVFVTKNGGQDWENRKDDLALKSGEKIIAVEFSADGQYGVIMGDQGSVFVTKNGGQDWENRKDDLALKSGEKIIAVEFSADGQYGVIMGDQGSVFVTKNGGQDWENRKDDLALKSGEKIITVEFNMDGQKGIVVGDKGSAFVTVDGGTRWNVPEGLKLKEGEGYRGAKFSMNHQAGVAAGDKGSVFVTADGGTSWNVPKGLDLKDEERLIAAAFDAEGQHGVLAGDAGSVFVRRSREADWIITELNQSDATFISAVSLASGIHLAMGENAGIHLLRAYPELATWENRSLAEIRSLVSGDEVLPKSVIGREIINFLGGNTRFDTTRPDNDQSDTVRLDRNADNSAMSSKGAFGGFLDDLTVMRIVALTVLFFLVQVLVRLYQYNLRLAAFWDSRADAVLLARSFAYHSAERFDDLVATLAPDGLDFKPLPKSGHEALVAVLAEQLRRGRQPRES